MPALPQLPVSGVAAPLDRMSYLAPATVFTAGCFAADEMRLINLHINHHRSPVPIGNVNVWQRDDGSELLFKGSVSHMDWAPVLAKLSRHGLICGASVSWDPARARTESIRGILFVREARLVEVSLIINGLQPRFAGTFVVTGDLREPRDLTASERRDLEFQIALGKRLRGVHSESIVRARAIVARE